MQNLKMILTEEGSDENQSLGEIQDNQNHLLNGLNLQLGYLTQGQRLVMQSARPSHGASIDQSQFQTKKKIQRKILKVSKSTNQEKSFLYSDHKADLSSSHSKIQNQQSSNFQQNQPSQTESLYEVPSNQQSRLVSYQRRGLSFSQNKKISSCEYIITPKSNRRSSTNQSFNSVNKDLSSSESMASLSTAYVSSLRSDSVSQEKTKFAEIISQRNSLNDYYNQITFKRFRNTNVSAKNSVTLKQTADYELDSFEIENTLKKNFQFNLNSSDTKHSYEQNNLPEQNSESSQSDFYETQSSQNKESGYTQQQRSQNDNLLHNYFKFLLKKPEKRDIKVFEEKNTPEIKSNQINERKKFQRNRVQPLLTSEQKKEIVEMKLHQLKVSQQNEIKQFKISVNRQLEKLKNQYRTQQFHKKELQSTKNEESQIKESSQTQQTYDTQMEKQEPKYTRKISFEEYKVTKKLELTGLPSLKKGYSYQLSSTPDISCESPLTARLEKYVPNSVETKSNTSLNLKYFNRKPVTKIRNLQSEQRSGGKESVDYNASSKTLDFSDMVINHNQIRERTIDEVGEMAKYDLSYISRSPCKLGIYSKCKVNLTEERFKEIMKKGRIEQQFQEINDLLENTTYLPKHRESKQNLLMRQTIQTNN